MKDRDEHILMWDFDKTNLQTVINSLTDTQMVYSLSDIRILESNTQEGNYHAYCFTSQTWQNAVVIVAGTQGIDWDFVRLALYRGNFTLRVSKKLGNIAPQLVYVAKGLVLPNCVPENLLDYVDYEIWEK